MVRASAASISFICAKQGFFWVVGAARAEAAAAAEVAVVAATGVGSGSIAGRSGERGAKILNFFEIGTRIRKTEFSRVRPPQLWNLDFFLPTPLHHMCSVDLGDGKYADRTYISQPMQTPTRGVQPMPDLSDMNRSQLSALGHYADRLRTSVAEALEASDPLGCHLKMERISAGVSDRETRGELLERASSSAQWVHSSGAGKVPSRSGLELEVRCCRHCNKKQGRTLGDDYMRLRGTRICVGPDCYKNMVDPEQTRVLPRIDVPTEGEVLAAKAVWRTSDPFITCAGTTMPGWSTRRDTVRH